jgi:hypothetical protein
MGGTGALAGRKEISMKRSALALPFLVLALAPAAFADTPIQFVAPNLQAPPASTVNGARFGVLHGRTETVNGVDFGLLSKSEVANLTGFSATLGIERVTGRMRGCSTAVINHHSSRDSGVNAALVNRTRTMDHGANLGLVNVADGYTMVDVGGVNISGRSTVQAGVVNVTDDLDGIQLGLLNFAKNGFLPVFPFFNFPKN